MEDHDANQKKRHNAFSGFVDQRLAYPTSGSDSEGPCEEHGHKKLKPNSEAPLSTIDHPLPHQLLAAFKENPAGSIKFQLFVSGSNYSPTFSPPPVYYLRVTSASNDEVEAASRTVDSGATPVLRETRLVFEGQFLLRSRL